MPFYPNPKQDDFNQELQICIAEALYDVDSIVADPGAYTREELATLHSQILSNLEWAWELTGGSEDQLLSTMMQISQAVATVNCQPNCQRTANHEAVQAGTRADSRSGSWLIFQYIT